MLLWLLLLSVTSSIVCAVPTLAPAVFATFYNLVPAVNVPVSRSVVGHCCENNLEGTTTIAGLKLCPTTFCNQAAYKYVVGYKFQVPYSGRYTFSSEGTALESTALHLWLPDDTQMCNQYIDPKNKTKRGQITVPLVNEQWIATFIGSINPTSLPTVLTVYALDPPPTNSPGTPTPTTLKPTVSPTSSIPTRSPSFKPTKSPTSSMPTRTPTTSIPTRMPTTSLPTSAPTTSLPTSQPTSSPTFVCPAGTFSASGYNTQVDTCASCPAGTYDLPTSTMRTTCDKGLLPCEAKYWCGNGAVLGLNYVKAMEHTNIDSSLVVSSINQFEIQVTKLVDEPIVWFLNLALLPRGITALNKLLPSPTTDAVGTMYTMLFSIEADLLEGLSGDGLNEYENSFPLYGRYSYEPIDISTFSSTIQVKLQLVSVVINPELFSYNLMIGHRYTTGELSPRAESQVINPLCSDDLHYTASICDAGLVEFAPNTTTSAIITSDPGSGENIGFVIDLTNVKPQTNMLLPALTVHTCIAFDMTLEPLGTSFTKNIAITLAILQICPPGTYSASGDNRFGCTPCEEDTYQPAQGSTICFPVSPGSEVNEDKTALVECRLGYMSQMKGCIPCSFGTYADNTASTRCKPCPSNTFPTTLQEASTSLDDCTTDELQNGFKNNLGEFQACPVGTTCDFNGITVATMKVNPGYYRTNNTSLDLRTCKENFCVPNYYHANKTSNSHRRLLYSAQNDSTYCTPHHRGHLCEICETGYVHRGQFKLCELCFEETTNEDFGRMVGLFFAFFIILGLGCAAVVLRSYDHYRPKPFIPVFKEGEGDNEVVTHMPRRRTMMQRVNNLLSLADVGGTPLKITIGYYQVVAGVAVGLRQFLPAYFEDIANIFSLLSLDFVKAFDFGCSMPNQTHQSSLLLATMMPLGFFCCMHLVERLLRRYVKHADVLRIGFTNLYIWIAFLVYPSIAKTIFQTFDCIQFDDGESVLEADPQINCSSEQYYGLLVYGMFCSVWYVFGVPVIFYILLDRQRFQLDPFPEFESRISLAYREKNIAIQGTVMLWHGYSPKRYNFEVFELVRKLFQTSVFVFISKDSAGQVISLLVICAVVVVVLGWTSPYIKSSHNALAQWAQWNIFTIAFVALLNRVQLTTGNERAALDAMLMVCLVSVPVVALAIGLRNVNAKDVAEKVTRRVKGESMRDRIDRVASSTYSREHSDGGYVNSAVVELHDILSSINVDNDLRNKLVLMVNTLDSKYQEENKVAWLQKDILLNDKTYAAMLQTKIAELTEENAELRFSTMLMEDQLRVAEEYKGATNVENGNENALMARRSFTTAAGLRVMLGKTKQRLTDLSPITTQ